LIKSHGGVFEITMGNDLIFSKKKLGRFPQPGEIDEELAARIGADAPA
jgi:selenoprotein W-related protein